MVAGKSPSPTPNNSTSPSVLLSSMVTNSVGSSNPERNTNGTAGKSSFDNAKTSTNGSAQSRGMDEGVVNRNLHMSNSISPELREFFHKAFYVGQLADNVEVDDPLQHFVEEGCEAGLSPHPLFSPYHYMAQDVDLEGLDPIAHYRRIGWKQGLDPHPLFSTNHYLQQLTGRLSDQTDPLTHYLKSGWKQDIQPHPWIWSEYLLWQSSPFRKPDESPLYAMLNEGMRKNNRPNPLYSPSRLTAFLRQHNGLVSREVLARPWVDWPNDLDFSPSSLVDLEYYRERYPEANDYEGGAFRHFVEVGVNKDYDPNPYFSSKYYRQKYSWYLRGLAPFRHYMRYELTRRFNPSENFSTRHYSSRVPFLRRTRLSLLEHFLETGRYRSLEVKPFVVPKFVKQQLREAASIDPEVRLSKRLSTLPVYNRHQAIGLSENCRQALGYIGKGFKVMVCVPYLARGGADLAAINLVRWLQQEHGRENVLLVMTDADRRNSVDWLPEGSRLVSFSAIDPKMKRPDREQLLQALIIEYRPEAVYNVNSGTAWGLISKKGKALRQMTRLYAHLFCFDFDKHHRPLGYAVSSLPMAIQDLTSIYLDNDAFRKVLRSAFNFPRKDKDKLRVLYQPLKSIGYQVDRQKLLSRLRRTDGPPKNVFWAGRLDPQKRPDLLLEIVKKCPDQHFHVYGSSVLGTNPFEGSEVPSNMTMYGEYREFFELPLHEADLFLYTSAWDGLPLILIDIQQSGIPVIVPDVGGITELVNEETGFVVSDFEDVDAYAKTIKDICSGKVDCEGRLEAAQKKVLSQHHWDFYSKTLTDGMAPVGGQPGPTIP